jgi:predicted HD superfamily hydrolase involved in NAD metabolism
MIEQIRLDVITKLKDDQIRLQHVFGVEKVAIEIASCYEVNLEHVQIAALFHDYCKNDTLETQIAEIDAKDVAKYKQYPVIYHALAAANILSKNYQMKHDDVLNAIKYHVWGREKMSLLEKIIFVSDLAEPSRTFIDGRKLIELAKINIVEATYDCMEIIINHLKLENKKLSDEQVAAFTYIKEELCGKT